MSNYLLGAISCLCLLTGVRAEKCSQTVLGRRETFDVPAGGSLSLSCVVQHCGKAWMGHWMWTNSTTDGDSRVVEESMRHLLTNVKLSANQSRLILNFLSVDQLDEGYYGCSVSWGEGVIEQGHLMYVNITAAGPCQRSVLHRVLVCAGAFLCLPIILGLGCCLSSEAKPQPRTLSTHADHLYPAPQPPPRCPAPQTRSTSSKKAHPKAQQRTEVVYADISQGALRQQDTIREPAQSTVYSSLKFS